jgi:hypothetical protein
LIVIPAKAGIHFDVSAFKWIPDHLRWRASGMTIVHVVDRHSGEGRNPF